LRVKKLRQELSSSVVTKSLPSPFKEWYRDLATHISSTMEATDSHFLVYIRKQNHFKKALDLQDL
jgi:hypothetical protein